MFDLGFFTQPLVATHMSEEFVICAVRVERDQAEKMARLVFVPAMIISLMDAGVQAKTNRIVTVGGGTVGV